MKLRKLIERDQSVEEEVSELFKDWQELSYEFETKELDNCLSIEVRIEGFDTLIGIFSSKDEAKGAFLSLAEELGWEKVPESFVYYHAIFDGNKVLAGIKVDGKVSIYDQLTLENMIRELALRDRIVVYSMDVITYIKDIYPEVDRKVYSISKFIAQQGINPPELETLAKLHGVELNSLEDFLNFIESLAKGSVKLEVKLPPLDAPTEAC